MGRLLHMQIPGPLLYVLISFLTETWWSGPTFVRSVCPQTKCIVSFLAELKPNPGGNKDAEWCNSSKTPMGDRLVRRSTVSSSILPEDFLLQRGRLGLYAGRHDGQRGFLCLDACLADQFRFGQGADRLKRANKGDIWVPDRLLAHKPGLRHLQGTPLLNFPASGALHRP